jgi:glucose 1-dehydrogenase
MLLKDKVAIVTGGDSGIGRAIAIELAKEGAMVTINYHSNHDAAEEVRQQIEKSGSRGLVVQGDVGKVADLQTLVDRTVQTFGRLDIMVNNAGMETRTSVLESSEKDFDTVISVNLKGAFFGTQLAARQMLKQGDKSGGRIINISSVHEDWPMPGNTPYCCAKGGMRMLTRTAGVELAPHGITVVGVGPGAVDTPINKGTLADPEKKAALNHAIPVGRVAEPEEIAGLVAWLASDKSKYVTSTTYFIDGGIMQNSVGL